MKNQIIIYGAGGHAGCLIDIIEQEGCYQISGMLDDAYPSKASVWDYPILGNEEKLADLHASGIHLAIVAIGNNAIRYQKTEILRQHDFNLIAIRHPFSSIARQVSYGPGTSIFHGAVIDPYVQIGKGVIVNKQVLIGHEAVIGDFVHLAPGVNCGSGVRIGSRTLIGIGATILPRLTIGADVTVGAGSVVTRDIKDKTTVIGTPAKSISSS